MTILTPDQPVQGENISIWCDHFVGLCLVACQSDHCILGGEACKLVVIVICIALVHYTVMDKT